MMINCTQLFFATFSVMILTYRRSHSSLTSSEINLKTFLLSNKCISFIVLVTKTLLLVWIHQHETGQKQAVFGLKKMTVIWDGGKFNDLLRRQIFISQVFSTTPIIWQWRLVNEALDMV